MLTFAVVPPPDHPLMRLSFPNAEYPDVVAGEGVIRIGSASDNDIVLADLADHHALLTRDARGIVLEIRDTGARAHVNARPVREKAFVRRGDTLCLAAISIVVSAADPLELCLVERPTPVQGPQRGIIRGMSGAWFGKSVAIADGLMISVGREGGAILGETADSNVAVRFRSGESGLTMQSEEPSGSLLNGRRITSTALRTGDQLTLGRDRFVIECSSAKRLEETIDSIDDVDSNHALTDQTERSISAIWWLLGAAALIGMILVAMLLRGG